METVAVVGPTYERAPSLIVPIDGMNVKDQIARRRKMVLNPADYTIWGKMYRLLFDPFGMSLPDSFDHPVPKLNELNWENDDPRHAPTLGLSRDDKSLLIVGSVPQLAPCEMADPQWPDDWEKTSLPGWQVPRGGTWRDGKIVGRIPAGYRPKRYMQRFSDLTTEFTPPNWTEPKFADPDCFLVIRPVSQIYIKLGGMAQTGLVEPITAANGTSMSFLINPKTREGHLIGGAIRLNAALHTLPEGAKP